MSSNYRSYNSYNFERRNRPVKNQIFKSANDAPQYVTVMFLTAVAEVIRKSGFFKELCASDALQLVVANKDGDHSFASEDFETAAQAIAWLSNKDVRPGFESDLLAAISADEIPQNKMRLAMYAVKMYNEYAAEKAAVSETNESQHIGSIKERLTLTVHVFSSEYSESEWGVSYRTKAATAEGNIVTWYAKEQVDLGDYGITGTVTKHNEYKGVKETYLNRVKVGA